MLMFPKKDESDVIVGMKGGGADDKSVDLESLPGKYPQVGVLSNSIVNSVEKDKFVWLEKTDGLRVILLLENGKMYKVVAKSETEKYVIELKSVECEKRCLFDCEMLNDKYYVFDGIVVDGEDVSKMMYKDRMKKVKEWCEKMKIEGIVTKEFYKVESWEKLLAFIENTTSPITGNKIDGVVCQRCDKEYFVEGKDYTCYKLKRVVMNTIDFYLSWKPDERKYYLYLLGTFADKDKNMKMLPRTTRYIEVEGVSNKKNGLYVLFASPYKEGLHKFAPREKWDMSGFREDECRSIDMMMSDIRTNNMKYDGKIVEMALAEDGWVPMRVRSDKMNPNGYGVGLSNCGVMFAPLNVDEKQYFNSKLSSREEITKPFHEISHMIRKYTIEHYVSTIGRSDLSVLDLAGGRGGDEFNLYHAGVNNIFAVDSDRDALVQYVGKTKGIYKWQWEPMLGNTVDMCGRNLLLNVMRWELGEDNKGCEREIRERSEFPREGFNIVLMNFAIHYVAYSEKCMNALGELIRNVLKVDGIFIFTCFDGDRILKDMKDGVLKTKCFEVKLSEKGDDVDSDEDVRWVMMPLPTIDDNEYRLEPLFTKKMMKCLGMVEVESVYPLEEFSTKDVENGENVSDYLKYVCIHVMKRKK